jgi:hypothetical protein
LNVFQRLLQNTAGREEAFRVDFSSDSGSMHPIHRLYSIFLANVQCLDNKVVKHRARISFQSDIRDCNILCFTETWLSRDILSTSIQPAWFSVHRADRNKELSRKKKGGVNLSWYYLPIEYLPIVFGYSHSRVYSPSRRYHDGPC